MFETDVLRYLKSYLMNRNQRVRVNKTFSEWEKTTAGVLQGSILGLLLFNIFLNHLFLFIKNSSVSNYADDNTLYNCRDNLMKTKDDLMRCINDFTKIIWSLMQVQNVFSCFLGITHKTKLSHSITSLWKLTKNKNISAL